MKKTVLIALICALGSWQSYAQSTYTSANFASVGDSFYLTNATNLTTDFSSTGPNYTWDFSTLAGNSQNHLLFRSPTQTGISIFIFPYIYNTNNTNLSSTDGTSNSLSAGGQSVGITDRNDYYKKSTGDLREVASSYKIDYNGTTVPITNQYSSPDVIYKFPIAYTNTDQSNSAFTTNIPNVLYQNKTLARTNTVDSWGTVTTPYGTFPNALRMMTNLVENDTLALLGTGLPRVIRTTRELKWFDASKKYPVLIVTQNSTNGNWVTTGVQFMDNQHDFQTTALFAYTPLAPAAGTTVYFQNLSTNATTYSWNFGDPTSGTSNTSTDQNPNHVFAANGTYIVTLTASNATYTDTTTLVVIVSDVLTTSAFTSNSKIVFYPNPFHDVISINSSNATVETQLLTLDGKIIYKGNNINSQDFSNLTAGIYLLNVVNGTESTSFKMIKN